MHRVRLGLAAGLVCLLAACQAPAPRAVVDANVERAGAGTYRLHWDATSRRVPVDVFVGSSPHASRDALKLLIHDDQDDWATVTPHVAGRPYFYVVADGGRGVWTAERVLPLEGGRNFRDLGGYRTSDGRRVKWGTIYRSGSMGALTTADYRYLSSLGIAVICDLRSTSERKAEPTEWRDFAVERYWARDYIAELGAVRSLLVKGNTTPDEARQAVMSIYGQLPYQQADGYREMFRDIAAGELPLAFNCTAGKDRTGVGAALLLTALGVPRAQVTEDYTLSNKVVDFRKATAAEAGTAKGLGFLASLPPDIAAALLSADPAYIEAMFAEIERRNGTVEAYLTGVLGLTDAELRAIRERLLE